MEPVLNESQAKRIAQWKDGRRRFSKPFYLYLRTEKRWIELICSGYKDEKYIIYKKIWMDTMENVARLIEDRVPCYARLATRDNKRQILVPIKKIRVGIGKLDMGAPRYSPVYILELDVANVKIMAPCDNERN